MKPKIRKLVYTLLNRETISYLFFGALTTAIGFSLFELFYFLGLSAVVSNTFSTVAAVLFAYFTNKIWVFESRDFSASRLWREILKFAGGRLATFLLESAILFVFVDLLLYNRTVCKMFTTVIVVVSNYIISKKAVFSKKSLTFPNKNGKMAKEDCAINRRRN